MRRSINRGARCLTTTTTTEILKFSRRDPSLLLSSETTARSRAHTHTRHLHPSVAGVHPPPRGRRSGSGC
uniref:Uncharacterized protein n=1 Tax=Leersia perrieri TaxID=77586 RepID=A0A0D9V154_9ORYZ